MKKIKRKKYDYVLDLDISSPLQQKMSRNIILSISKDIEALSLFSVNPSSNPILTW